MKLSYYQNGRRTGSCSCSSCQNRSGETWTRRNWNGCGCGNTSYNTRSGCGCGNTSYNTRSGCGCGNASYNTRSGCGCANTSYNTARSGCGCTNTANNTARSGCGCVDTANNGRSGCGCAEEADHKEAERQRNRNVFPCQNQGTEWRNRNGCGACAAARTLSCPLNPCNSGAADTGLLSGQSLAMVYSPFQNFEELYDPREGLCSGTIFNGLNKPFCPKCGC